MKTTTKVASYYLPLATVLITAGVVAAPFQQAVAQEEQTEFLVRIVQAAAQAGLLT